MKSNTSEIYTEQRRVRLAQIEGILFDHGLQDTLQAFIKALEKLMGVRGKSIEALCVLEGLKGAYAGYMRRYEPEDEVAQETETEVKGE